MGSYGFFGILYITSLFQALDIIQEIGSKLTMKYSRAPVPSFSEMDPEFRVRYKMLPDTANGKD